MNLIDIKRVCYHECCHAIVARVFRKRLTIEQIFVNEKVVKEGQDIGAIHVNGPHLEDEQDFTVLAITLLAGVVGDNMYLSSPEAIKERKEDILANNALLDWLLGGGDIPSFMNSAYVFTLLYQVDEKKLKEFSLRFLIDFLSDKEIWAIVENLSDKLFHKDDMKMNQAEMDTYFKQIGLDSILNTKHEEYQRQLDQVLPFCRLESSQ